MGKNSSIGWTDHTFNGWWGCEKVSPACRDCYAEKFARRTGFKIWGSQAPRRFLSDKHWAEPLRWDRAAAAEGVHRRVFCGSMCDWAEDRRDLDEPRLRLFGLIEATPHLDWLMLTKRPENIPMLLPKAWHGRSRDNMWLGITAENEEWIQRRARAVLSVPAPIHFVSYEPALGPIDWRPWLTHRFNREPHCPWCEDCIPGPGPFEGDPEPQWWKQTRPDDHGPFFDWVIVGGESGPKRRPMDLRWVESTVQQCTAAGVAVFVKQDEGLHPGKQGRLPDALWQRKEHPEAA